MDKSVPLFIISFFKCQSSTSTTYSTTYYVWLVGPPGESPKVRGFLVSCNILIVIMAQTPFLPNLYKSICIHSNCHCNPQDSSRHGLLSYRCISTHQWLREFSTKLNFHCFDKNMASHFFSNERICTHHGGWSPQLLAFYNCRILCYKTAL